MKFNVMKFKEYFKLFKFLKNCKSCIVLKDDLQLRTFGEKDEKMENFHDAIMLIQITK